MPFSLSIGAQIVLQVESCSCFTNARGILMGELSNYEIKMGHRVGLF